MRFSVERIARDLPVPVTSSSGTFPARESLVVKLETGSGFVFGGECAPWINFGVESLDEDERFLKEIGNAAPEKIPESLPCLAHAFSAANFFAKNPHLQNQARPEKKECAKLIPRAREHSATDILESLKQELATGYLTFKIKVGLLSEDEEIRFCEKILNGAPAKTKIRFDANGAFSEKILPALITLSSAPQLDFFEQPLRATKENDALIFSLADENGAKFALDESIRSPWEFPRTTNVVAVIKPLLIPAFPQLLNWLEEPAGADIVISTVFENSSFGRDALFLACARIAKNRRRAFGLG